MDWIWDKLGINFSGVHYDNRGTEPGGQKTGNTGVESNRFFYGSPDPTKPWIANTQPWTPEWRSYIKQELIEYWNLGVRRIFLGGSNFGNAMAADREVAIIAKQLKFHVCIGVSHVNSTWTSSTTAAYRTLLRDLAHFVVENNLDGISLGNEEEGHNDNTTMTDSQVQDFLIGEAAYIREYILTDLNKKIIYRTYGDRVAEWNAKGFLSSKIDVFGSNHYGSSQSFLPDFKQYIDEGVDTFGDRFWVTEYNLYFDWNTITWRHERQTRGMIDRYNILRKAGSSGQGVPYAYQYRLLGHNWSDSNSVGERSRGFGLKHIEQQYQDPFFFFTQNRRTHQTVGDKGDPAYLYRTANELSKVPFDLGKAYDFDQATSSISLSIPSSPNPFTTLLMPDITFAAWLYIRSNGGGSAGRIFSGINNGLFECFMSSGTILFQVHHTTTVCGAATLSKYTPFNKWIRFVGTFNRNESFPRVFIDGREVTSATTNKAGSRIDGFGTTYIGNRSDGIRAFDGLMDRMGIWGKLWSRAEIIEDRRTGIAPAGMLWGAEFEEASGQLLDQSGRGNHGTVTDVTRQVTSFSII